MHAASRPCGCEPTVTGDLTVAVGRATPIGKRPTPEVRGPARAGEGWSHGTNLATATPMVTSLSRSVAEPEAGAGEGDAAP